MRYRKLKGYLTRLRTLDNIVKWMFVVWKFQYAYVLIYTNKKVYIMYLYFFMHNMSFKIKCIVYLFPYD